MQKKVSKFKAYRFRILSGVLFGFFLVSTWLMFYQKPEYPEELHISLQEQLKTLIHDNLLEQKPHARNLRFKTMWTQSTHKRDQISAHFKYSFDDDDQVNLSVEGKALMNRKKLGADEKYDLWSVDHIEINNTKLKFQEPITLFSVSEKFKETELEEPDLQEVPIEGEGAETTEEAEAIEEAETTEEAETIEEAEAIEEAETIEEPSVREKLGSPPNIERLDTNKNSGAGAETQGQDTPSEEIDPIKKEGTITIESKQAKKTAEPEQINKPQLDTQTKEKASPSKGQKDDQKMEQTKIDKLKQTKKSKEPIKPQPTKKNLIEQEQTKKSKEPIKPQPTKKNLIEQEQIKKQNKQNKAEEAKASKPDKPSSKSTALEKPKDLSKGLNEPDKQPEPKKPNPPDEINKPKKSNPPAKPSAKDTSAKDNLEKPNQETGAQSIDSNP